MGIRGAFAWLEPTPSERSVPRPGDELVDPADVVMDRAFDLDAAPELVWPWLVQLGKKRAGWYFPRLVELVIPRSHRAIRHVEQRWQDLGAGDVIPDYGGASASFTVAQLDAPNSLVYYSERGRMTLSWSIVLEPAGRGSRVFLRLRLAPVRRPWLASTAGGLIDLLTIAGMAGGLRERVTGR